MNAIKSVIFLYDIITLPIYAIFQRPWTKRSKQNSIRAKLIDENDVTSGYVRVGQPPVFDSFEFATINELFSVSCKKYGERRCLGVRKCIQEEEIMSKSNKPLIKKILEPEYTWYTFSQIDERIDNVMKGFLLNGFKPHDIVIILSETRLEWLIAAHALFRLGCVVATVYDTLGSAGIIHAIDELEASHLITVQTHVPTLQKFKNKLTKLNCVVTFESSSKLTQSTKLENNLDNSIKVISFDQIEEEGSKADSELKASPPKPFDLALIMFTSGSTGYPKGIQITHHNFVSSLNTYYSILAEFNLKDKHTYVAYLPLAHIFEFILEHAVLSHGFSIGFSSTLTLTDYSACIKPHHKGDASVLKPTIIASVPLILDRMRKDVYQEITKKGEFMTNLFDYFMNYKNYWLDRGWSTPLLDYFVFKKFRQIIGGKVKILVSGGASLSVETQKFCRIVFNANPIIGYGATEISGAATATDRYNTIYGSVGAPLYYNQVKLIDWEEGGYSAHDKPNPRGEIVVHSESVATGYFKNEEESKKSFVVQDGKRWFYTGDIGEMYPNGTLKIIDRKKDLVKLVTGEYVPLGKVSLKLRQSNLMIFNIDHNNLIVNTD